MANYIGTQVNDSVTIVGRAGEAITDVRYKLLVYDAYGLVVLATDGSKPFAGIAISETGEYDISGAESGKVGIGEDVDIQIKDIATAIAGENINMGDELTATTGGKVAKATAGDYVFGIALKAAENGRFVRVRITNYQKNA